MKNKNKHQVLSLWALKADRQSLFSYLGIDPVTYTDLFRYNFVKSRALIVIL